jgi:tetratricopeptide (TPR) repeat protein
MIETGEIQGQISTQCEICGREDDTVRFVSYPFVFSFVVVTFQRAFTGCWCRFHRIQKWLAASFITSIFGWFGIPFGILLTPVRLLQLARGGLMDKAVNGHILRTIGEQKLHSGDIQSAVSCFEASLMFVDDPHISEQLRNLYRSQLSSRESSIAGIAGLLVFPAISIVYVFIGMFVGGVDFIVWWLSSLLPTEISVFVFILLQVPFVVFVYFCMSALYHLYKPLVCLTKISSTILLSVAGLVISLVFLNGIISGGTYSLYISYFLNGFREPDAELLTTIIAILTRSGLYTFSPAAFTNNFYGSAFYAGKLVISLVLLTISLLPRAKTLASQQERIAQLQSLDVNTGKSSSIFGWIGLGGFVLCFVLIFMLTPQKSTIDALEAVDHISIGQNFLLSSQPNLAIAEYQAAIELKPEFAPAHILLGNVYLSLGETDKSHDCYLTATMLEPDNPAAYTGLGWSYFQQGKYELAENKFIEALEIDTHNMDAYLGLGWVYLQIENYDLAGKKFTDVLSVDNRNISGHLGLGWVYLNQFNFGKSRKEFEYIKSIAPENADASFGLGVLELLIHNYDNSIDIMNEALRLNSNLSGAYYYKGLVYYRQGKYSDAEAAYQSALRILPNNYDVLIGLGDVKVANYEFEEGIDYYDKAITIQPERADAYLNKANVLIHKGKLDEAFSLIQPFAGIDTRIKPIMAGINYLMGKAIAGDVYLRESVAYLDETDLGSLEKAQGYFAIAGVEYLINDFARSKFYSDLGIKSLPIEIDANTYFFWARVNSSLGDYSLAQTALDRGSNIGHSEVSLHYTQAELLINQGRLDEAEQELLTAIEFNDRSSDVYVALSFIHYQQGNLPRALVDVNKALQLDPYNSYAHNQLAYVYQAQGRVVEALVEAQESLRLNTLVDTSHYILGLCYMESGKSEEAIREFEKFLDLYWDRAYVREYKVKAEGYLEQLRNLP